MGVVLSLYGATDAQIRELRENPESIDDFLDEEREVDEDVGILTTSLDKAWHGLHYLFTRTAWQGEMPLNFLVAGGEPIGDQDYGPARAFTSREVELIREAVHALSPETLRTRFDRPAMKKLEIYPDVWDRDPKDDDTLGYLLEYRGILCNFLHTAARDGLGMIITIC